MRFLRTLGFEPSYSTDVLVLPYDKPLKRIMIAREALVSKLSNQVETVQSADVESRLTFPTFQKYSELFGVDLTDKTNQAERQ